LKEKFFASGVPVQWQGLLRLGVGEARGIFRSQLDGLFGQLSQEIRNAITAHVQIPGLDNEFVQSAGAISDSLKGAKLDGYAKINGDAMSALRVNGELQLALGKNSSDDANSSGGMKFSGFYEATELENDTPPVGCILPG